MRIYLQTWACAVCEWPASALPPHVHRMGIDLNLAKVLLDTGEDVGVVRGLPHAEHKNQ